MMLSLDFSIFPILETERLILKEITNDHAPALFDMRTNPNIMRYIDRPIPQSIDEVKDLIQKMATMKFSGEGISWGIFKKDNPEVKIGNIGFYRIMAAHYRAEIGYMLHTDEHRKGIMYEAMHKVIDFGFKQMKLHSIEANINPENLASKKLLEKAGFVREAYFKENYYFNGKFIDSEIYSFVNKEG
jgi:ribosomal-protein-alanine N-acetyltransferase